MDDGTAASFPILNLIGERVRERGRLNGTRIAWNCHLTSLTAMAARTLLSSGCILNMSECNPNTSDEEAIKFMSSLGIKIFRGENAREIILAEKPEVISDTGFDLIASWLESGEPAHVPECSPTSEPGQPGMLKGACEITTSGITRLRKVERIPIPVININHGKIKSLIENFHGVGDGLIEALKVLTAESAGARKTTVGKRNDRRTIGRKRNDRLTTGSRRDDRSMTSSAGTDNAAFQHCYKGNRALVVGYGNVGSGVAQYLKREGLQVTVVDIDPVRKLVAHYDGFDLSELDSALSEADILVTATGQSGLLAKQDWQRAKDGLLVINVGHFKEELGIEGLEALSQSRLQLSEHLTEYFLTTAKGGIKRIRVATQGDPANVVLLTGSIEPTLLHLSTEILAIEHVAQNHVHLPKGELPVPEEVEKEVARLALQALGI